MAGLACEAVYRAFLNSGEPAVQVIGPCQNGCQQVCAAAVDINVATYATWSGPRQNYLTDRGFEQRLREDRAKRGRFGVVHPERAPLYCRMLADATALLGHDTTQDKWQDHGAWNVITQLTLRADQGDGACLRQVWAAVPQTEAAREVVSRHVTCYAKPGQCLDWYDPPIRRRTRRP